MELSLLLPRLVPIYDHPQQFYGDLLRREAVVLAIFETQPERPSTMNEILFSSEFFWVLQLDVPSTFLGRHNTPVHQPTRNWTIMGRVRVAMEDPMDGGEVACHHELSWCPPNSKLKTSLSEGLAFIDEVFDELLQQGI